MVAWITWQYEAPYTLCSTTPNKQRLKKAEEYDDSAETQTGSTVELAVSDPSHPALLIK